MRWVYRGGLAIAAVTLLGVGAALAQTDIEVHGGLQFNFNRPGARSIAMGGAAVGLDGDPSSAFSNPGGMTTLPKPELSVEGRGVRSTSIFTDHGRLLGSPSGNGIDTVSGLVDSSVKNEKASLS